MKTVKDLVRKIIEIDKENLKLFEISNSGGFEGYTIEYEGKEIYIVSDTILGDESNLNMMYNEFVTILNKLLWERLHTFEEMPVYKIKYKDNEDKEFEFWSLLEPEDRFGVEEIVDRDTFNADFLNWNKDKFGYSDLRYFVDEYNAIKHSEEEDGNKDAL